MDFIGNLEVGFRQKKTYFGTWSIRRQNNTYGGWVESVWGVEERDCWGQKTVIITWEIVKKVISTRGRDLVSSAREEYEWKL